MNPNGSLTGKIRFGSTGLAGGGIPITFDTDQGGLNDRGLRPGGDIIRGPNRETTSVVRNSFEIMIGAGSGATYSWTRVSPAPLANFQDASIGSAYQSYPALEMNGNTSVPSGKIVTAFEGIGPFLVFNYTAGSSSGVAFARITGSTVTRKIGTVDTTLYPALLVSLTAPNTWTDDAGSVGTVYIKELSGPFLNSDHVSRYLVSLVGNIDTGQTDGGHPYYIGVSPADLVGSDYLSGLVGTGDQEWLGKKSIRGDVNLRLEDSFDARTLYMIDDANVKYVDITYTAGDAWLKMYGGNINQIQMAIDSTLASGQYIDLAVSSGQSSFVLSAGDSTGLTSFRFGSLVEGFTLACTGGTSMSMSINGSPMYDGTRIVLESDGAGGWVTKTYTYIRGWLSSVT